jgi:hypothetical protein
MYSVFQEYSLRKEELKDYYLLLSAVTSDSKIILSNNSEAKISNRNITILKANNIIILYNLIESTITNVLIRIHDEIKLNTTKYEELIPELQILLFTYYNLLYENKNNIHESAKDITRFIQMISGEISFDISYSEMTKYYSLYSGNIDKKRLYKIFFKYGIKINIDGNELDTIKNKRNALAHGKISFEECGRDLTIQYIDHLNNAIFRCMENILNSAENYLQNQGYKSQIPPAKRGA